MAEAYQPDVTSYDYDAPIDEMGRLTPKYQAIRELLSRYQPEGTSLPEPPAPLPAIEIATIVFTESASLFDHLPPPVSLSQPKPMEYLGQSQGFILYRTGLRGHYAGQLRLWELHDYASVYVDGIRLGSLSRAKREDTIEIPKAEPAPKTLDILVEAMGHINFGPHMIDRKGITERVTLNGMTLMDWQAFPLPLDAAFLARLTYEPIEAGSEGPNVRPGRFFRGAFELEETGDTCLDMSGWSKGLVWVNGHNLGRYWDIGPQERLFCPAPFLRTGRNEIVVFDLLATGPSIVRGVKTLS
jgi:hypothetical protein